MKKIFAYVLALAMAACLLGGCREQPAEPTAPEQSTGQTTEPTQAPTPEQTTEAPTENYGYLLEIRRADQSVFDGPSYDNTWVGVVEEEGVYTILEEVTDAEGNLWGRLKSGVGWVDLTDIRAWDPEKTPISANFADDRLLASGEYEHCVADITEDAIQLAFRLYEPVYDFSLSSLQMTDDGFEVVESYFMLPEMTPERPLVADLVFPGDMSAYGISFRDSDGNGYHYIVTLSGRNGTVELSAETA